MKWIDRLARVLEGLEIVLAIPLALSLAILNLPYVRETAVAITGHDPATAIPAMLLFVLATVVTAVVQDRKIRRTLISKIDLSEMGVIRDRLPSNLATQIEKAKRVMLIGVSGLSYVEDYESIFESKIGKGDELDLLITDPDGTYIQSAASRDQTADVEYERQRIRATIDIVARLQSHHPKGRARLKRTNAPIDGDYIVLYDSKDISKIYYKHYGYKTRQDSSMYLHLNEDVPDWFGYFKQHVGHLWDETW